MTEQSSMESAPAQAPAQVSAQAPPPGPGQYQAPLQGHLPSPVPGQVPPPGPFPHQAPTPPLAPDLAQARAPEPIVQPFYQAHDLDYGPSHSEIAPYPSALLQQPRDPEAEARRKHRRHNTVRWVSAVVLATAVAAGSALAVMQPKRTDVPGLATTSDGRYAFPALVLPTLAPGEAVPGDPTDNPGGQHLADIRKLLLPAPQGAVPDKSLPGAGGWVPETTMAAMDNPSVTQEFAEYGLRHTAGVAWKTPDGATTSIYLMQYADNQAAKTAGPVFDSGLRATSALPSSAQKSLTTTGTTAKVTYLSTTSGGTSTRYGYFTSGDTSVLIIFSAPNAVPLVPFEQEIQLQSELLH